MSTIRLDKALKTALKKLGESGDSYQTIIANLRMKVIGIMVRDIASEIYDRESITKQPESKIVLYQIDGSETYINDDGSTGIRNTYKWGDGRDDVECPVIHRGFTIEPEYSIDKIKQETEKCVNAVLKVETMLLSKMGETDHIYLSLPFQILMWGDAEYNIHFTMRTSLTSSATRTFEEACEATKS